MDKTLIILMGVQGSGKSTFYHARLATGFVRVNLDTLKTRNREQLLVEECLMEGKSYAIDNTNPTRLDRERYIPAAKAAGYRIVGYFFEPQVEDCLRRNAGREGKARVPDIAIYSTAKRLEPPSLDEGFDELFLVRNDDKEMSVEPWQDAHSHTGEDF